MGTTLEDELHGELDFARRPCARENPEAGTGVGRLSDEQISVGVSLRHEGSPNPAELGVVEEVEVLGAELQVGRFTGQRVCPVAEPRSLKILEN